MKTNLIIIQNIIAFFKSDITRLKTSGRLLTNLAGIESK